MESITEIADRISKEQGYKNIDDLMFNNFPIELYNLMLEAGNEYAKQIAIEQRQKCSEKPNGTYYNSNGANVTEYVISSILTCPLVTDNI